MSTHNCTHYQFLVERGANGGVYGEYVTIINTSPNRHVNIRVIDNHRFTSVPIATVGGLAYSHAGPFSNVMHQYEYHLKGNIIQSSVHLGWYNHDMNDKSSKVNGGEQRILTHEG